jgi:hypothetical protein
LFETPRDQSEIDFANEGGETYICGNPPYVGDKKQSTTQKDDMRSVFESHTKKWRSLDYVSAWFMKAADYGKHTPCCTAFVSTNSVNQGQQVPVLWPLVFGSGHQIIFAHSAFKWTNLAAYNAGVIVVIIGISNQEIKSRLLFSETDSGENSVRSVANINAYLAAAPNTFVHSAQHPISDISEMLLGNFAKDGGNLICEFDDLNALDPHARKFLRPMFGGAEFIKGLYRYCFWIHDIDLPEAMKSRELCDRFQKVTNNRLSSPKAATAEWSSRPHRFVEIRSPDYEKALIIPIVSSENRSHLPVGFLPDKAIVNYAFALYDAPLWNMALIASRIHLVWIGTVCGKMKSDFRYSNTLGWNTFPVPSLTEQNKADLTRCAEDILLARESHFPATIADLYDPENMPANLRAAHERNDETLERIYIGRRFKNDTERLEKLFELYTKMTANAPAAKKAVRKKGGDA